MNHNTTENDVLSIASIFAAMTDQRKPKGLRLRVSNITHLIEFSARYAFKIRPVRLPIGFFIEAIC